MKRSATDDWEPSYLNFCAANQHLVPAILERERAKFSKPEGDPMSPNERGPIYASIQGARKRVLTPDEKIQVDKLLDALDVPSRFK